MRYGRSPVSTTRLALGAGRLTDGMPLVTPIRAAFRRIFAAGGNCFDTAHIYAGGLSERNLAAGSASAACATK
jgi:aryl-alcohol dehydrogenase-like predicted oxidoreductase